MNVHETPESLGLLDWTQIEALFDKAIDFPALITHEEKYKITEWIPSCDEMESRVQKHLNCLLDDLFHHAATDRDSLTYADCVMIHQDFHLVGKHTQLGRDLWRMHWSNKQPELYTKWERAWAAVLSDLELRAVLNVNDTCFYSQKQSDYFAPKSKKRELERPGQHPPEWIQRIINQGGDRTWGY